MNRRSPSGPPPHLPNGAKKTPRKSGCPPTGHFCHTGRGSAGPQKSAHGFPPALLIAGGMKCTNKDDCFPHGTSPAKAVQLSDRQLRGSTPGSFWQRGKGAAVRSAAARFYARKLQASGSEGLSPGRQLLAAAQRTPGSGLPLPF